MAGSISTNNQYKLSITNTYTGTDLSTLKDTLSITESEAWTEGTGTNEASLLFHDQRTAGATADEIDLSSLTNAANENIEFSTVKLLYINNLSTVDDEDLSLGWAGGTGININANGNYVQSAPVSGVDVSGANSTLTIEPFDNSITYKIVILGT